MIDRLFGRYSATGTQRWGAIEIDAAWVIDGSLAYPQISNQIALHVDLEHMADSRTRVAVKPVDGLSEALRAAS